MVRIALGFVLVIAFACGAPAADRSEKGKAGKPNAVAVSELLKQTAKSPLGPDEARLLRAVAELIEKEQVQAARLSVRGSLQPASSPSPVTVQAPPPLPAWTSGPMERRVAVPAPLASPALQAAPTEQRKRLVIRLINAPVDDVVKALEEFLISEQKVRPADELTPHPCRAILVPEPGSNSLLISGTPKMVNSLTGLIATLDARPDMVMAHVCIANFVIAGGDAKPHGGMSDDPAADKAPSMEEDGAAWLAWAIQNGRLEVLSRPQIMTLVDQPAMIQIGSYVSRGAPNANSDGPARPSTESLPKVSPSEPLKVGVTVSLTPRISPEGLVVMKLEVEQASIAYRDRAGEPIIGKVTAQTTISAQDGQTVVVGGMTQRTADGYRELIIAVTPRVVNATR